MRKLIAVLFMVLLLSSFAQGQTLLKDKFLLAFWLTASATPEESYYVNAANSMDARFAQMAAAHFNLVQIAPGCNSTHLDLCSKYGLKAMVEDARMNYIARDYPGEPSEAEIQTMLDGVVADWSSHAAVWGYIVLDEPNSSRFPRLRSIVSGLQAKDPGHVGQINLLPTYASPEQLGAPTYPEYVSSFISTVDPDNLAWDHYPLMADGSIRGDYFQNLEWCRSAALANNLPLVATIQSLHLDPYVDPTAAQMRWEMYTNLVYGTKGVFYFEFFVPTFAPTDWQDALVDRSGNLTPKYEWAKTLNAEVMALSPVLMKLTSTGVYHVGTIPAGTTALPSSGLAIKGVSGGKFVVGFFSHENGAKYAMIANKDFSAGVTAKTKFAGKVSVYRVNRTNGSETKLSTSYSWLTNTTTANIPLAAGDAELVRIAN